MNTVHREEVRRLLRRLPYPGSCAFVVHPETNGQFEWVNGMVLSGLKPQIFCRLKQFSGQWAAELPAVLSSLWTSQSRATGIMSFFMVYGSDAILLTDLDYGSPRTRMFNEQGNETALEDALD